MKWNDCSTSGIFLRGYRQTEQTIRVSFAFSLFSSCHYMVQISIDLAKLAIRLAHIEKCSFYAFLCISKGIVTFCQYLTAEHITGSSVEHIIQIQFGLHRPILTMCLYITIVPLMYAGNPGGSQIERNESAVALLDILNLKVSPAKSCLSNISSNDVMSCWILNIQQV